MRVTDKLATRFASPTDGHAMLRETLKFATRADLRQAVLDAMRDDGPQVELNHFDVSAVRSFVGIFEGLPFNGDISRWNVRNAENMTAMFRRSSFNGDVSRWDVRRVDIFSFMFQECAFSGDLSQWNVSSTAQMQNTLNENTMASMAPTVFHWAQARLTPDKLAPAMREHFERLNPIALGLQMGPTQAACWMHSQWTSRSLAASSCPLPDLFAPE